MLQKPIFIGLLPFFRPIDFSQFTTDPHESMDFDGFTLDFSIKLVFFYHETCSGDGKACRGLPISARWSSQDSSLRGNARNRWRI